MNGLLWVKTEQNKNTLWTLKCEFHIIPMLSNITDFFQLFKNVKVILYSSGALQK